MNSTSNGKQKPNKSTAKSSGLVQKFDQRLLDLDLKFFISPLSGMPVRVDEASDEEFDTFIRQYIALGWTLTERMDALADAITDGQEIAFYQPEKVTEKIG